MKFSDLHKLSAILVNAGGCSGIVDYINESQGGARLPGIMTLGYIAAFSETMAKAIVDAKGIPPLVDSLKPEYEDHVRFASAWTLGQIGRHSPEHAKAVADLNGLSVLVEAYKNQQSSEELKVQIGVTLEYVKIHSLDQIKESFERNY